MNLPPGESKENAYLHLLNTFPLFGPKRLFLLLNFLGSSQKAWEADTASLVSAGLDAKTVEKFQTFKAGLDPETTLEQLGANQIRLVGFKDSTYPELLKEISNPPPLLYIKGTLPDHHSLLLAVVGTRKITSYSRLTLEQILPPLLEAGVILVSGLAFGVDEAAHRLALKYEKPTVAVLAGGLDDQSIYPKHHQLLATEIIEQGGCLLSEQPPQTPAYKQYFVSRNRIISGLAKGVMIPECGLKSGTLITARYALEQNRTLYAVPGPIYSQTSQGPNSLLKSGAVCVTDAQDILSDLNLEVAASAVKALPEPDDPSEKTLLSKLSKTPTHIDELSSSTGQSSAEVGSSLTMLELKGYVKNLGGMLYVRIR